MYRDRDGRPIDLLTWAKLSEDTEYRFVGRDALAKYDLESGTLVRHVTAGREAAEVDYCAFVITIWIGFDPYGVSETEDAPLFETTVFRKTDRDDGICLEPKGGRVWVVDERYEPRLYSTLVQALQGHYALLDQVRHRLAQEVLREYERAKGAV